MEVKFDISDDVIKAYTPDAKKRLVEECRVYAIDIISESEKIERNNRATVISQ